MRWRDFGGVLYESRVACGIVPTKPPTWPRDALRLSEHRSGYEPESTKEGVGPNSLRNCRWVAGRVHPALLIVAFYISRVFNTARSTSP